jgi:UPF0716 protein FxsA
VPLILLLIIVGVPILELMLLIEVGKHIGAIYTVGLVIVTAAIGITLVRMQGYAALTRAQASLDENRLPVGEAVDGVFLLFVGGLLLFPGFITDAIGLLLLIPFVRRGLGLAIWRYLAARGVIRWSVNGREGEMGPDGGVIDGEFEDVTNRPKGPDEKQGRLEKPADAKKKPKDKRE